MIAPAHADRPLARALAAEPGFGTTFLARPDRLSARKSWIAFARPSRGKLEINHGALEALLHHGRSLLRVGVVAITGTFEEGDAVEICAPDGEVVAKGLVRVPSVGFFAGDDVVVHRDDLVLLRS